MTGTPDRQWNAAILYYQTLKFILKALKKSIKSRSVITEFGHLHRKPA